MLGIEAFFTNYPVAPGETLMQVPDTNVERLSVEDFRRELAGRGALHDVVARYAQAKIAEMIHTAACNALHQVQQRCARWLLMTHDRMHEKDFNLSHEFLAVMLGVQRPTVSVVAATLQQAGLIRYTHGHVTVTNRKGLEAAELDGAGALATLNLARRFRENPQARLIPFIIYGHQLRARDIDDAARAGVLWLQLEPADGARLVAAVRGVIAASRRENAAADEPLDAALENGRGEWI